MIGPRKSTTRLAVGPLESRWIPAGNVTAQLLPDPFGDLTVLSIVGDSEANEIRVVEDAPGHVRIEGLGSTTINGKAADELFAAGDLRISFAEVDLGNGNDFLSYEFTGDQEDHRLSIVTGRGDDSVAVLVRGLVGRMTIDTGAGHDSVTMHLSANSAVFDGLIINTGTGDDTVFFRADSDGGRPNLLGSFHNLIFTEQGNDVVQFQGEFGAPFTDLLIDLGEGDDTLIGDPETSLDPGTVEIHGGLGHDTLRNASYFNAHPFDFETIED